VARYLVELYLPNAAADGVRAATARAHQAAAETSKEGAQVRCLRSIFVPEDETWFLLYDADSAEAVRNAVERAALQAARVVEAIAPR
jgi:hypothetical protein